MGGTRITTEQEKRVFRRVHILKNDAERPPRGRENEIFPPRNWRVSFDGKSVKSHDWIILLCRHGTAVDVAVYCGGIRRKRRRENRQRRKKPSRVAGWRADTGVKRKTRENKIHTRPLARVRFVHFIRANWIYLCGRLPARGREGRGGWKVAVRTRSR